MYNANVIMVKTQKLNDQKKERNHIKDRSIEELDAIVNECATKNDKLEAKELYEID